MRYERLRVKRLMWFELLIAFSARPAFQVAVHNVVQKPEELFSHFINTGSSMICILRDSLHKTRRLHQ